MTTHTPPELITPALDDDYRLSALWRLTTPVWQSGANLPPLIW